MIRRGLVGLVMVGLVVSFTAGPAWAWDPSPPATTFVTDSFDGAGVYPASGSAGRYFLGSPNVGASTEGTWALRNNPHGVRGLVWDGHAVKDAYSFDQSYRMWVYGDISKIQIGCNSGSYWCYVTVDVHPAGQPDEGVPWNGDTSWVAGSASRIATYRHGSGSTWDEPGPANPAGTSMTQQGADTITITTPPGPGGSRLGWYGINCALFGTVRTGNDCWVTGIEGLATEWHAPTTMWAPAGSIIPQPEPAPAANGNVVVPACSTFGGVALDADTSCGETPPSPPAPQLACGRTMHDMGGGQWYAEVRAIVRNPPPPGADYSDHSMEWATSDSGVYYGNPQTIALPAGAAPGDGRKAMFTMYREWEQPVAWSLPENQRAAMTEGGPGDLTWENVTKVWDEFLQVLDVKNWGDGTLWAEDEAGAGLPMVPTVQSQVKRIQASCTTPIDPDPENEGVEVIVVVNLPDNPDDPNPPGDGGAPSPSEECSSTRGGITGIFADMYQSMKCALQDFAGGILGAIGDAIGELLSWLMERFGDFTLPGVDPGEWSSKFPLSMIGEVTGTFGALHDGLEGGLDSPCGPTLDPNLDGSLTLPGAGSTAALDDLKVSLPSPSTSCEQSDWAHQAADLAGFRQPLRAFFVVLLYGGFIMKVAHSIGPGRNGAEPS